MNEVTLSIIVGIIAYFLGMSHSSLFRSHREKESALKAKEIEERVSDDPYEIFRDDYNRDKGK